MSKRSTDLETFMEGVISHNPGEVEFHQAVRKSRLTSSLGQEDYPEYMEAQVLERMAEPDRVISFRVCWEDDNGNIRVNRGYRIQNNNAIGPYKGGIRFHPSVNQSILKISCFRANFQKFTNWPADGWR